MTVLAWQRLPLCSLLLLMGLMGCSDFSTIRQVQEHPHRNWFTATVHLKGKVGDRAPLIGGLLYQLQDDTGKIWVLTKRTAQPSGQQIAIEGQVRYQSIPIAGQELGEAYIEEQRLLTLPESKKHEH
jgi:hypothetical protein